MPSNRSDKRSIHKSTSIHSVFFISMNFHLNSLRFVASRLVSSYSMSSRFIQSQSEFWHTFGGRHAIPFSAQFTDAFQPLKRHAIEIALLSTRSLFAVFTALDDFNIGRIRAKLPIQVFFHNFECILRQ